MLAFEMGPLVAELKLKMSEKWHFLTFSIPALLLKVTFQM